ncbi:hypothetical protein FA13DRAFT_1843968 [Coprinellus micaceus]|uniref:Uncharacterized protein n=1 Tax=Coprinellus micaceus TaxID=71717 RepID=A0A4Y7SDH1_COPMI|nr:hypothetical protein FA13DRAFT_1843968 [Coprinellus micaceus]
MSLNAVLLNVENAMGWRGPAGAAFLNAPASRPSLSISADPARSSTPDSAALHDASGNPSAHVRPANAHFPPPPVQRRQVLWVMGTFQGPGVRSILCWGSGTLGFWLQGSGVLGLLAPGFWGFWTSAAQGSGFGTVGGGTSKERFWDGPTPTL